MAFPTPIGGAGGPQAVIEQRFHTHINVEGGVISADVLDDVIQQITKRVRNNDIELLASDSLRLIRRS